MQSSKQLRLPGGLTHPAERTRRCESDFRLSSTRVAHLELVKPPAGARTHYLNGISCLDIGMSRLTRRVPFCGIRNPQS